MAYLGEKEGRLGVGLDVGEVTLNLVHLAGKSRGTCRCGKITCMCGMGMRMCGKGGSPARKDTRWELWGDPGRSGQIRGDLEGGTHVHLLIEQLGDLRLSEGL